MSTAIHWQPANRSNVACGHSIYRRRGIVTTREVGATTCRKCQQAVRENWHSARNLPPFKRRAS